MVNLLNIKEIQTLYPDEWVLIGDPVEQNGDLFGTVIIHEKNKKDLVQKAVSYPHKYQKTILRYTGVQIELGKWLKFTH